MILIAISEPEYKVLVSRAEASILQDFNTANFDWSKPVREDLIAEAERIGCTPEFIEQLKKDL